MKKTLSIAILLVTVPLCAKIMGPEQYRKQISSQNNADLIKELDERVNKLIKQEEAQPGIEGDIAITKDPSYKKDMYDVVKNEIAKRLGVK